MDELALVVKSDLISFAKNSHSNPRLKQEKSHALNTSLLLGDNKINYQTQYLEITGRVWLFTQAVSAESGLCLMFNHS